MNPAEKKELSEKVRSLRMSSDEVKQHGHKYAYGWTDCINEVLELINKIKAQ